MSRPSLKLKALFAALMALALVYLVTRIDIAYTTRSADSPSPATEPHP